MKKIVAALTGASLLAAALPASAQFSHHGGWGRTSSDAAAPSASGGGFGHSATSGPSGFGGASFAGRRGFRPGFAGFRGYPFYFADFGLGLALGLSFIDPWYYDGGYYGYYGNYAYGPPPPPYYYPPGPNSQAGPPPPYYYPPAPNSQAGPPPPAASAQSPAACGSWSWDTAKQVYNWVPC